MVSKRLNEIRGINADWHWCRQLEFFTDDSKCFQLNWFKFTFQVKPWEVNKLPIFFGVRKNTKDFCLEVNGKNILSEIDINKSINGISNFILNNVHNE